jgi:ubiquinone/menaquinone biosynthesis C-methylase UbiE
VTTAASPGNAEQVERWNGDSAQKWIANRERHRAAHQRLIPHLFAAAAISPGDRVLDVGCGCGETTITAATAAPGGGALGLDLSAPMLEVARQLAAEAGAANARFEQGDAQVYPLGLDRYDVVISKFGVMFFDDPAAAFANIAAAVRPGGRLAFLCWQDDDHNEIFGIPLNAFKECAQLAAPDRDSLFADPRQVTELLNGAGWTDVRTEAITEQAWLGTDVVRYVRRIRMVENLIAGLADGALAELALATAAEQYSARLRPDGVWIGTGVWLVTARRGPAGPA